MILMPKPSNKKTISKLQTYMIITGIILITASIVSEIIFHFIQGFNTDVITAEQLWAFEPVEAFNSTTLLIAGAFLVIIPLIVTRSKKKRK